MAAPLDRRGLVPPAPIGPTVQRRQWHYASNRCAQPKPFTELSPMYNLDNVLKS